MQTDIESQQLLYCSMAFNISVREVHTHTKFHVKYDFFKHFDMFYECKVPKM